MSYTNRAGYILKEGRSKFILLVHLLVLLRGVFCNLTEFFLLHRRGKIKILLSNPLTTFLSDNLFVKSIVLYSFFHRVLSEKLSEVSGHKFLVVQKNSRILKKKKIFLKQNTDLELIPFSQLAKSLGLYGLGRIDRTTESLTVNCRVQLLLWILKNIFFSHFEIEEETFLRLASLLRPATINEEAYLWPWLLVCINLFLLDLLDFVHDLIN